MRRDYLGFVHHSLGIAYYAPHVLLPAGIVGLVVPAFVSSPILAGVTGGIAATVAAGSAAAWVSLRMKQRHFQNPQLDVLSSDANYVVAGSRCFVFEHAVSVRARVDGVHCFRSKFKWTGLASVTVGLVSQTVGIVTLGRGDGIWEGIEVTFDRPLMKREKISFTVRLEWTDTSRAPLPLLKKLIDDNLPNGITMRVTWDSPPTRVRKEIFGSIRAALPLSRKVVSVRGTSFVWHLRIVRPYQAYQISWDDLPGIPAGVPTTLPGD